jgi:CheY-like chemotaxis protein
MAAEPGPRKLNEGAIFLVHAAETKGGLTKNVKMKRILLVEDDPNDVELTLTALKEFNLANEVVVVSDGAEALDFLFKRGAFSERVNGNPVVILLDLKLPKISGMEVLKQIRESEALKMIPVVILTSSREERS